MKYSDIPKYTKHGQYQINCDWEYLESWIERQKRKSLEINPDFQRGHIWTNEQQIAYIEYKLRGGHGSDILYFNCTGWMNDFKGPFVLVDGLQRLTAVRNFSNNKIKVFNHYIDEFENKALILAKSEFLININDLETRKEVLQWYLEINTGGTPHTEEEIERVRILYNKE